MENKEIRFQALVDSPDFMRVFENTKNDVLFKQSAALEARELSEKLEKRDSLSYHIKNSLSLTIGGSAFKDIAMSPIAIPVSVAFGFAGWLQNKLNKVINKSSKDDESIIHTDISKNKKEAQAIIDKTDYQFEQINRAVKEYRDMKESFNNGTLENTVDNKNALIKKIDVMNNVLRNFIQNPDNARFDDEHRQMTGIVADSNKLLSRNALAQKLENMNDNVKDVSLKTKHGM